MNQGSLSVSLNAPQVLTSGQIRQIAQLLSRAARQYDESCSALIKNSISNAKRNRAGGFAEKVLNLQPDNTDALNLLCRIALDENDLTLATQFINKACALEPDSATYQFSKGHVHLAKHQYKEAESSFRRAINQDPNVKRAHSSLAYTNIIQGKYVEAFQLYRKLIQTSPEDKSIRSKLFESIGYLKADFYDPLLAEDCLTYLQFDDVNYNELSQLISTLIVHKYQLNNPQAALELSELSEDKLLISALRKLVFTSAELEHLIVGLRRTVLIDSLSASDISRRLLDLAVAIGFYCANNEYLYPMDAQEESMLNAMEVLMKESLADPNWVPENSLGLLIMLSMYLPLHQLDKASTLAKKSWKQWPEYCRDLIKHCLHDVFDEINRAKKITSLDVIKDPTSMAVQQQYEENPYPRWLSLNYHTPTPYGQALQQELAEFTPPGFLNSGEINILVAGCGTGKHALQVANYFRDVKVLAVDLSRRSLAYAEKMAKRYHISNISFLHADILSLQKLHRNFHIIECTGVLHHMQEPAKGMEVLSSLLQPGGLLKIGLYSERARQEVVQCRELISMEGKPVDAKVIREFRQKILRNTLGMEMKDIISSPDFYNLSGCRDLLFHVQEHRFNPLQLEEICIDLNLDFLGFVRLSLEV